MTRAIITFLTLAALSEPARPPLPATPPPLTFYARGMATFYSAGVMQSVLRNRNMHLSPGDIAAVALIDPVYIGRRVWIKPQGLPLEGPFLVADCANAADMDRLAERDIILDVDRETATRWNMNAPYPVAVYLEAPTPTKDNLP